MEARGCEMSKGDPRTWNCTDCGTVLGEIVGDYKYLRMQFKKVRWSLCLEGQGHLISICRNCTRDNYFFWGQPSKKQGDEYMFPKLRKAMGVRD